MLQGYIGFYKLREFKEDKEDKHGVMPLLRALNISRRRTSGMQPHFVTDGNKYILALADYGNQRIVWYMFSSKDDAMNFAEGMQKNIEG